MPRQVRSDREVCKAVKQLLENILVNRLIPPTHQYYTRR